MKPGTRIKSAVCDTEVMVIRAGEGAIACGGAAMFESKVGGEAKPPNFDSNLAAPLDPDFADGTLIGKRYVDAAGTFELLCVKPGKGSLSVDGVAMTTKDAKPLPASD